MTENTLVAQSAFSEWRDIVQRDLKVLKRDNTTIAHVCAAKNKRRLVNAAMHGVFGVALPSKPECVVAASGITIVWAGPDQWLFIAKRIGERDLEAELAPMLKGLAVVTDQSDARTIVQIGGKNARALLAKGVPIDLDPRVFPAGSAAITHASHIGVVLWSTDASPTFELAVFRSFAGSFMRWIHSAAAEWGYVKAS